MSHSDSNWFFEKYVVKWKKIKSFNIHKVILRMIKLAICDDEEKELNKTKSMCDAYRALNPKSDIKISTFTSSKDLLECISQQEEFNIFLLDIYMPMISGMELARMVREKNEDCQIVFLTTSVAHAVEAFSIHATHYLVKPYTEKQLEDALSKAIVAVNKQKMSYVTLKISGGVQRINYKDFLYSETERHVQKLHLADDKILQVRITSLELYELLSQDERFFKCGSTYVINLNKVEEITTQYILFENGDKLPMQRRQYKEMLEQYTRISLEGI